MRDALGPNPEPYAHLTHVTGSRLSTPPYLRATAGEDTESRYQRRRRLLNNARWGKDGKWAKMADTLESVPVLGETALAPMTGFLRGAVDLYTTFRPDA